MYNKLIRDFKRSQKLNKKIKPMGKNECIKMIKKEFKKCIKDKSLEVNMTYSRENPIIKFEFIEKENND